MRDVLAVTDLCKSFGGFKALNNLSFRINQHEIIGLLGPNGAGKSTLIKILANVYIKTSGDIEFSRIKSRRLIGYLPDQPNFYAWMTAEEYLLYVLNLNNQFNDSSSARELLHKVGLSKVTRLIGGFSTGMKQRLGIAQALIGNPVLLLLDEPVSALDPIGRTEVIEIIKSFKSHSSVIFSTHILNDAQNVCDRYLIINNGKIIANIQETELETLLKQQTILLTFIDEKNYGLALDILKRFKVPIIEQNSTRFEIIVAHVPFYECAKLLIEAKIIFSDIRSEKQSLNDYFLNIVTETK